MSIDPVGLTISKASEALRAGEFSALELTEACLKQISQLDSQFNAFITITPEEAVLAALSADAVLQLKATDLVDQHLLGMPVVLKDLFDTAGIKTTAGSRFFKDRIATDDAEAVLRLKQAGACSLGKTNTHEIALGVTGVNPHFGAVKNPWNTDHVAGGSSSGSAVAVATGMCLAALGTDTGGSTRIPASLCGVVGLKPTYGRISTRGVIPLSWNLDHVGVLTRTVRDAALMLEVLAGFDPQDPTSQDREVGDYLSTLEDGVKDMHIAMAAGPYVEESNTQVLAGVEEAGRAFRDMGAKIEVINLSWIAELAQANSNMTQADAAEFHHDRLYEHADWFGEDVRLRLEMGERLTAGEYIRAGKLQAEGRRRFEILFHAYDLIVLPTTPIPAPRLEGTEALEAARQLTRFTSPFNLAGLPAISIPCGWAGGLPFGVQLVTRHWDEAGLLRAGAAYERSISAGS